MTTPDTVLGARSIGQKDISAAMMNRDRKFSMSKFEARLDSFQITPQQLSLISVFRGGNPGWTIKDMGKIFWNAATAMTGDINGLGDDIQNQVPVERIFKTVLNTARLASALKGKTSENLSYDLERKNFYHDDGLFRMNLKWDGIRILDVGFFVDDVGNLVVANSQRHTLGRTFRSDYIKGQSAEKDAGDAIMKKIEHETGMKAEFFGAVFSSLYLGDAMDRALPGWSGRVLFTEFEQKTDIKAMMSGYGYENRQSKIMNYISELKEHMDLRKYFGMIGVNTIRKYSDRFFYIDRNSIKNAFENYFTDDQKYQARYKYRKAIYDFVKP